jgi:hypothetical protein
VAQNQRPTDDRLPMRLLLFAAVGVRVHDSRRLENEEFPVMKRVSSFILGSVLLAAPSIVNAQHDAKKDATAEARPAPEQIAFFEMNAATC